LLYSIWQEESVEEAAAFKARQAAEAARPGEIYEELLKSESDAQREYRLAREALHFLTPFENVV